MCGTAAIGRVFRAALLVWVMLAAAPMAQCQGADDVAQSQPAAQDQAVAATQPAATQPAAQDEAVAATEPAAAQDETPAATQPAAASQPAPAYQPASQPAFPTLPPMSTSPLAPLPVFPSASMPASEPASQPLSMMPTDFGNTIVEVRVVGNERVTKNAILAKVHSRVGEPYVERVAVEDQRRLLDSGRFADVQITSTRTDKGVVVAIHVREHEFILGLISHGNHHFSDRKVRTTMGLTIPGPVDYNRIEAGRQLLLEKYKSDAFYFADVRVDEDMLHRLHKLLLYITEGPRVRVKKVSFVFDGPQSYSSFKLRQQVKTRQGIWIFSRGKLEAAQLPRDAADLKGFYRDHGYLDVEATPEVRFTADRSKAYVYFIVREGPRYRVNEVQFEGNIVYSGEELRHRLKLVTGRWYDAQELSRDSNSLKTAYGEIGNLYASVHSELVYLSENAPIPDWAKKPGCEQPPALVNLRYHINEGKPYRVGKITIRGNDVTKDRVIRRQVRFFPDQLFDTAAADESKARLKDSGLFKDAKITPYGEEPDVRDALVAVQEGETARFGIGVGVSTNTGVEGTINFVQQNFSWTNPPESLGEFFSGQSFKGDGQTFRVDLVAGTVLSNARMTWREPYLFDRNASLGVGVFATEWQRETYNEDHFGANASLGHLFPNRWYGELSVQPEFVKLTSLSDDTAPEIRRDAPWAFLTSFGGTLVRDNTDSRWLPSKGDRLTLNYQQFVGDYVFGKASIDYSRYWTLYTDALDRKHILAGRVAAGQIFGTAPVYEKYYGGGLGSIRGFKYRGISPRSAGGPEPDDPNVIGGRDEVIGGDRFAFAGSEYTFPIAGDVLRGAFFVDSGSVMDAWSDTTWRVSTGVGLRIAVPFLQDVPMSLDLGFPIVKTQQDDTQLFSFSFGWVF